MARGICIIPSRPSDRTREDEYNSFYERIHLPEVCSVPGVLGARRYRLPSGAAGGDDYDYLAVYDLEGDDLSAIVAEVGKRMASGEIQRSELIDVAPPALVRIFAEV